MAIKPAPHGLVSTIETSFGDVLPIISPSSRYSLANKIVYLQIYLLTTTYPPQNPIKPLRKQSLRPGSFLRSFRIQCDIRTQTGLKKWSRTCRQLWWFFLEMLCSEHHNNIHIKRYTTDEWLGYIQAPKTVIFGPSIIQIYSGAVGC